MSISTEVERMVATLVGDATSYHAMLREALTATQTFAEQVGAAMAAVGGVATLSNWAGLWSVQEESEIRLASAISSTRVAAEGAITTYKAWASEVQNASRIGDETTLRLLSQAEAYGKVGQQAQQVVGISVALAGVLGGSPAQHMRIANAVEEGNYQLAAQALGLRHIKDQGRLVAEVQRMLAYGLDVQAKLTDTGTGRYQQMMNALRDLKESLGRVVMEGMKPVFEWVTKLINWVNSWSDSSKRLAVTIAAVSAGLLMLGPAFSVVRMLIGPLISGISMLISWLVIMPLKVLLNVAVWLAWKTVTLALTTAIIAFKLAVALLNGSLIAYILNTLVIGTITLVWKSILVLLSPVILAVKVAVWLLNAALTATQVVMIALGVVMAGIIAIGLAVAFVAIASAVRAVYEVIKVTWSAIKDSSILSPLRAIRDMFSDWGKVLTGAFRALLAGDFTLVGRLLYAGLNLAVAQMYDLFPPLWQYLRENFAALSSFVQESFTYAFKQSVYEWAVSLELIAEIITKITGIASEVSAKFSEGLRPSKIGLDAAERKMKEIKPFPLFESQETASARHEVDKLLKDTDKLPTISKSLSDLFGNMGGQFKRMNNQAREFDVVFSNTAEAAVRYATYLDKVLILSKIRFAQPGIGAGSANPATLPISGPAISAAPGAGPAGGLDGGKPSEAVVNLLTEIRDGIYELIHAKEIEFEAAGLS